MNYTEISDAIRYIGVDDDTIDLFESQYVVPEGMFWTPVISAVLRNGLQIWRLRSVTGSLIIL